jgi:hypothetical protein
MRHPRATSPPRNPAAHNSRPPSAARRLQAAVFHPFCYSPRGTSALAERSRRLRDLVKCADSATLAACYRRIVAMIEEGCAASNLVVSDFLGPNILLVPVPPRVPHQQFDPTPARDAIARALRAVGLGKTVWPALRRWRVVPFIGAAALDVSPGFAQDSGRSSRYCALIRRSATCKGRRAGPWGPAEPKSEQFAHR